MNGGMKVYIIGAGPGAADLITVRGSKVLGKADIVFHDALIPEEMWRWCRADILRVDVGKRCGEDRPGRQDTIHRELVEAARRYRTVVRLKGGDPCVFGRGGEEIAHLAAHGIEWEVVPGISAGVGGASLLGLPLTHRDHASSVILLTASQAESGTLVDIPWHLLSSGRITIVFYLCMGKVGNLAQQLIRNGLAPATPAACLSRISWPDQKTVSGTLASIASAVEASKIMTPGLFIVGDVVAFWEKMGRIGKIQGAFAHG